MQISPTLTHEAVEAMKEAMERGCEAARETVRQTHVARLLDWFSQNQLRGLFEAWAESSAAPIVPGKTTLDDARRVFEDLHQEMGSLERRSYGKAEEVESIRREFVSCVMDILQAGLDKVAETMRTDSVQLSTKSETPRVTITSSETHRAR